MPGQRVWWNHYTPTARQSWAGCRRGSRVGAAWGRPVFIGPCCQRLARLSTLQGLPALTSHSLPLKQVEEPLPQSTTEAFQHLTSPTDLKITAFLSPPNKLLKKKKNHRAGVFTRLTAGSICHRSLSLNQYFPSLCSQAEFLPRVNSWSSGHPSGLRGPGIRAISLLMIFQWG